MGSRSRPKRRRTANPSAAAGVHLISGLGDDVLLRVLELLPDARDAARTGALSRRWRGLWTRLPELRFDARSRREFRKAGGASRFVAFVDDALALRAAQTEPAVQRLAISFGAYPLEPPSAGVEPAWRWLRYAVQHALKSFVLELRSPIMSDFGELPCSAKLETMRLSLVGATLRLPAAAGFASLVDLSLEHIKFVDCDVHQLARFLSPACCPRLQKLRVKNLGNIS